MRLPLVLACAMLCACVSSKSGGSDRPSVPGSTLGAVAGWTLDDSVRSFTPATLFDLIDGGADLYLEYGFVKAEAAHYRKDSVVVGVEVYAMTDEEAAFGIYSSLVAGSIIEEDGPLGGSATGDGYRVMWKGRTVCAVTRIEGESDVALQDVARRVSHRMEGGEGKPRLIRQLERGCPSMQDMVFFRGHLGYLRTGGLLPPEWFPAVPGASGRMGDCSVAVLQVADAMLAVRQSVEAMGRAEIEVQEDAGSHGVTLHYRDRCCRLEPVGQFLLQVTGPAWNDVNRVRKEVASALQ